MKKIIFFFAILFAANAAKGQLVTLDHLITDGILQVTKLSSSQAMEPKF